MFYFLRILHYGKILFYGKISMWEENLRVAHISDLHLGKSLHSFSLIDDQEYILLEIVKLICKKNVDAIVIAGDVYDKGLPSVEAIRLLRKFINELVKNKIKVFIISGNHDSAERLTFGAEFMTEKDIYFSKVFDGNIEPICIDDEFGKINFYLLPFIKPLMVKQFFPEEEINSYEDAVSLVIKRMNINSEERNILVGHQNIMNTEHCDSEETIIGGVDAIPARIFSDFDYVALGHIHKAQKIEDNVFFSGTPLKYSISELNHDKVLPIIDFKQKGKMEIEYIQLLPKRDIRQIRGSFDEILKMADKDENSKEDYIDIILTDENEVIDAIYTLRSVYPNILQINYDNFVTRNQAKIEELEKIRMNNPVEMFEEFYLNRSGSELSDVQKKFVTELIESIWSEEE